MLRYLLSKLLHYLHEPSRLVMSQAWTYRQREIAAMKEGR